MAGNKVHYIIATHCRTHPRPLHTGLGGIAAHLGTAAGSPHQPAAGGGIASKQPHRATGAIAVPLGFGHRLCASRLPPQGRNQCLGRIFISLRYSTRRTQLRRFSERKVPSFCSVASASLYRLFFSLHHHLFCRRDCDRLTVQQSTATRNSPIAVAGPPSTLISRRLFCR